MNATTHNHLRVLVLTLVLPVLACLLVKQGSSMEKKEGQAKKFQERYWDLETERRMEALDSLKEPVGDRNLQLLFTVSHWDPELRVRLKAFRLLVNGRDDFGYLAMLAGRSLRLDYCGEAKARKAELMRGLNYRWEALNALCEEVIRLRYPGYGTDYRYFQSPFHECPHAPCKIYPVSGGWWWGWNGSFRGIGGLGPGIDHGTWMESRKRLSALLETINYLGSADFKLAYNVEGAIRKWWRMKSPEFLETDLRERERVKRTLAAADLAAQDQTRQAAEAAVEGGLQGLEGPGQPSKGPQMLSEWLRNQVEKAAQGKKAPVQPGSLVLSLKERERLAKAALATEEED